MKKFLFAFMAVVLVAGLVLSPVAAAPALSPLANEKCGGTYTVKHNDSIYKIAAYCGVPVYNILALNPELTDPGLIRTGQVLRLTGQLPATETYSKTYRVKPGDTLSSIMNKFDVTFVDLRDANPDLWYEGIYVGEVLNIPVNYSTTGYSSDGYASVSLSTAYARAGNVITVYVSGFPANARIDYRLGEEGEEWSVAYDGIVAKDGTAIASVAIPYEADLGEYWVVVVTTTSQAKGVEAISPTIYING